MRNTNFLYKKISEKWVGIEVDLNYMLGKYGYIEDSSTFEKCKDVIKFFFKDIVNYEALEVVRDLVDVVRDCIYSTEEVDIRLNKNFCRTCEQSCCNLRNTSFFVFGDIIRGFMYSEEFNLSIPISKQLNQRCIYLGLGGCELSRLTRPIMCLSTVCSDWNNNIKSCDIFIDNKEKMLYNELNNIAHVCQSKASKLLLESVYGIKLIG